MADPLEGHERLAVEPTVAPPLAIDALFRAHASYVAAIGLRLLGRRDEVDDLVQDVFLAAYRARDTLRTHPEVRGWLVVVAVRTARRRLRLRRLRGWLHLDDGANDAVVAPGPRPDDQALLAQVYAALDRMPVNHRLAWTLRHVNGEDLGAVATALACSLATAKRWIAAAQAQLASEVRS